MLHLSLYNSASFINYSGLDKIHYFNKPNQRKIFCKSIIWIMTGEIICGPSAADRCRAQWPYRYGKHFLLHFKHYFTAIILKKECFHVNFEKFSKKVEFQEIICRLKTAFQNLLCSTRSYYVKHTHNYIYILLLEFLSVWILLWCLCNAKCLVSPFFV